MASEAKVARNSGISARTRAYNTRNLTGGAGMRQAIYNRGYALIAQAERQNAPTNRITRAVENMERRLNLSNTGV